MTRLALLVVFATIVATLGSLLPESPSTAARPVDMPRSGDHAALGAVPDGTTVFDDDVPEVARLDPDLLAALRHAATDAGGVRFVVDSGRRSPAYQARLLREAVSKYGSEAEAARWVAAPNRSAHVSGD